MRPRQTLTTDALALLDAQAGVISTPQLVASGVTTKVVKRLSQQWQRLSRGIYLTGPARWESAVWAGLLRGGEDATVGGLAACHLERTLRDAPSTVLIWARQHRQGFRVGEWDVEFRRGTPPGYRHPPRTRIHRSLLDVAETHDEMDTVATLASVFSRQKASPERLLEELATRRRQRHRETILAMCDPTAQGTHSVIEWLFLRDVVRAHRLPAPDLQVRKRGGRVDAHYRQFSTIVELDGMRDHGDWSRDMFRDNEHLLEDGSITLRYGLNAMREACLVADQLVRRLRAAGWRGGGGGGLSTMPRRVNPRRGTKSWVRSRTRALTQLLTGTLSRRSVRRCGCASARRIPGRR